MWECKKCGACCEILHPMLFKIECKNYDKENRLCKIYKQRPEMCRVKKPEITEPLCMALREIRRKDVYSKII